MPTDLLAGATKRQPVDLLAQQPATTSESAAPGGTSAIGIASNLGGGFNTGLAQVLGLPVDLVNAALARVSGGPEATSFAETAQGLKGQLGGQIGQIVQAGEPEAAARPRFDQALGGGQQFAGLLEGTPLAGAEPQTGVERITRRIGEELGATAVPLIGQAGRAVRGAEAATPVVRSLIEGFRQAPAATTATEIGLATTAGAGGALAQEVFPESQGAELAGQLIGGLGPVAATGAVRGAAQGIRSKIRPTTPEAVRREVAEQLQTSSTDPNRAVANIEGAQAQAARTPGFELETGQAVNDPGISALQKRRMQVSPALQGQVETMRANSNQAMRQSLDQIAPANDAGVIEFQQGVRQSVDQMLGALDKRIADATKLADDQARLLGTGRSQAEASDVTRDELQNAADAFLEADRAMFNAVDPFNAARAPVSKIDQAITGIRRDRSPAEAAANFPSDIAEAFGRIAPKETRPASTILGPTGAPARAAQALPREASFKDLRAFRSRILDEIRMEQSRVPSNRRRVSNMVKIRESVDATLDDIAAGNTASPGDAVERLRAANAFHREGVQKFRQGPVGRVLRKGKLGEDAVPRSATIGEFFRSGKGSRESVDSLTRALGSNATPAVEDFVADEIFAKTVGTNGRVDPQRLQRWMTQNRQPLAAFPSVRQKLGNVANAERLVAERVGLRARSAADVEKGALGLVLNRDPETVTKGLWRAATLPSACAKCADWSKATRRQRLGSSAPFGRT